MNAKKLHIFLILVNVIMMLVLLDDGKPDLLSRMGLSALLILASTIRLINIHLEDKRSDNGKNS